MVREALSGHLFVGNAAEARNLSLLHERGITAVLDLAIDEPPARLNRELICCRFPLSDDAGNTDALIETAIHCLVLLIKQSFCVLVACSAGMSRSPAIAAAALALVTHTTPDECLLRIAKNAPHDISPPFWAAVKRAHDKMVTRC